MDYDKLVQRLHITRSYLANHPTHGSWEEAGVVEQAADAITKLRAERDALAAQLTGYDAAREMLNVQDNKIDTLRAVLDVARSCIYSLDAREIYADELDRIDAALAGKDAL